MNDKLKVNPHNSSLGMNANILGLLCYLAAFVLGWIPVVKYVAWAAPLVIYLLEKESPFVKYHAMQALLLQAVNWVFIVLFGIISSIIVATFALSVGYGSLAILGVLTFLLAAIGIALTVFAIIAAVKAYGYYEYRIPVVGNLAMKWSRKGETYM